jgi:hypothetical protein
MSKRSRKQCKAPAVRDRNVCRMHGGKSTGPKTLEGRHLCANAKTVHGRETRKLRAERTEAMRRLRLLEELGYRVGLLSGSRTSGRKPK